jgi:hypothetical protein
VLVLIGSCALAYHIDLPRKPADLDLVGSYDEIQEFINNLGEKVLAQYPINSGKTVYVKTDRRIIEAEVAWPDSMAERLKEFVHMEEGFEQVVLNGTDALIPSLNCLYMLKMSHRYLKNSPHFEKTRQDIKLMRQHGAFIPESAYEFYNQRMKDTYNYSHPKLNKSKDEFFTDNVPYIYDHDSIHVAIKHLDKPAYMYFKVDEAEVQCSKNKFEASDENIKLLSVVEESMVLAIERSLVPYTGSMTPREAFDYALFKCCTSISSGWWREFAYENYDAVRQLYLDDYFQRFSNALLDGRIKPYQRGKEVFY